MEKYNIEFLRSIELFSSLTNEEIDNISSRIHLKEFKKNEILFYEEDTNEFMYIIIFGRVKVFQTTEDGKEIILAIHGEGEFFGEMSLIDEQTVPATVSIMENSLIAVISKKDFYGLIFSQRKVLENLLRVLCLRLRDSWKKIQMLNFKNASHRIKMIFLMLSEAHGKKTAKGVTLNIKLTHQDIADMTGLTRESVTRVIDKWQRDGEITILSNRFIRLNPDFVQNEVKLTQLEERLLRKG